VQPPRPFHRFFAGAPPCSTPSGHQTPTPQTQVEYPDSRTTLVLMPAKFNKMLWVRRGGYLIVEESQDAQADSGSRVTGTIVAVLYDEHIKQLRKIPGVWCV